ncbi:MAG: hypothetical protein DMF66_01305 [Acidobacteria bacterium]|nr:MAG: hypothetical protein DMF66_01305 [Acidobacteriota bacterium]
MTPPWRLSGRSWVPRAACRPPRCCSSSPASASGCSVVRGQKLSLRRYAAALTRRDAFITQMEEFLSGWDGWLCPVASVPAFTHRWKGRRLSVGEERLSYSVALGSYVTVFNLTGCPAVVLPVERPVNGLPMGVQLVGGRWKDMELLDTAELLTEVTGEFQRPPSY